MKLKLSQIVNINAVNSMINLKLIDKFNAKISYNLSKTTKNFFEELASYEKIRVAKVEPLCEKDEDGKPKKNAEGNYILSEENLKIVGEEMAVLQDQEVEIYCTPISIAEIGHIEGISINTFNALPWLFVE